MVCAALDGFITGPDPSTRPPVRTKATTAASVPADDLLNTHVADYQSLYNRFSVNLGRSSQAKGLMDTASPSELQVTSFQFRVGRGTARAASGQRLLRPPPELREEVVGIRTEAVAKRGARPASH